MNPFDPSIFTNTSPCIPCCPAPAACSCALLIPPFGSPYSSYADALAVVNRTNPRDWADCYGYISAGNGTPSNGSVASFSVDVSVANQATILSQVSSPNDIGGTSSFLSISVKAGSTLTINYNLSGDASGYQSEFDLYDCTGNFITAQVDTGSANPLTGSFTYLIASEGEYVLQLIGYEDGGATLSNFNWVVSSDKDMVINPVIALWDDSGTTRSLWACPKLIIPTGAENGGSWYASCADAASDIAAYSDSCIGFFGAGCSSFSASGGGSLTLNMAGTTGFGGFIDGIGGFNGLGGDTIGVSWSATAAAGTPIVNVSISDETGTLIWSDSDTNTSGSFTSSALPFSGRYTFSCSVTSTFLADAVTATFAVTSSGTMSTNTIQAYYDIGLTCAAQLNCGDTCP